MTTLSKTLKDSNGNAILPKTRAEQVFLSDNTNMSTKINDVSNSINVLNSRIIHYCTHEKIGTVHKITTNETLSNNIVYMGFYATTDYNAGDTFNFNDEAYTPYYSNMTIPAEGTFKTGSLVLMLLNTTNKTCFFNNGGALTPPTPEEPTDEPTSYQIIQAFTADTTWVVPETKWYRIIAVGKSGNGGSGGSGGRNYGSAGGWGAGGNAGGIVASTLFLEKDTQIPISVSTAVTSFGSDISATAGGLGGSGTSAGSSSRGTDGAVSPQYGDAYGGNKVNITGMQGFNHSSSNNPSWGGWYVSDLPYINQYFVPVADLPNYCAGARSGYAADPGKSHVQWFNLHVLLSGAGGGGSAGWRGNESGTLFSPGSGGTGQPGVLIIEKAIK